MLTPIWLLLGVLRRTAATEYGYVMLTSMWFLLGARRRTDAMDISRSLQLGFLGALYIYVLYT